MADGPGVGQEAGGKAANGRKDLEKLQSATEAYNEMRAS